MLNDAFRATSILRHSAHMPWKAQARQMQLLDALLSYLPRLMEGPFLHFRGSASVVDAVRGPLGSDSDRKELASRMCKKVRSTSILASESCEVVANASGRTS